MICGRERKRLAWSQPPAEYVTFLAVHTVVSQWSPKQVKCKLYRSCILVISSVLIFAGGEFLNFESPYHFGSMIPRVLPELKCLLQGKRVTWAIWLYTDTRVLSLQTVVNICPSWSAWGANDGSLPQRSSCRCEEAIFPTKQSPPTEGTASQPALAATW